MQQRGLKYASEDLKQQIRAKATKVKRYEERNKQFRQNRLFESDQGKVFDELERVGTSDETPDQEVRYSRILEAYVGYVRARTTTRMQIG